MFKTKSNHRWNGAKFRKNRLQFTIVVMLFCFLMVQCSKEESNFSEYILNVKLDPSSNYLEATARISNPPDSIFYLNKNLKIHRILSDGFPVSFQRDSSASMPYSVGIATTIDRKADKELIIEYSGKLTEVINGVNMIDSGLVELALYAGWYPMFTNHSLFNFIMEADLPAGYETVSNGNLEEKDESENRNHTTWRSIKPGFDIVLLASPALKKMVTDKEGTEVEIFYDKMPGEYVASKIDRMTDAMNHLSGYYGQPRVRGLLRFVYSPRSGWGYSRIPLFVVSEEYALSQLREEFGEARDFHGAAHEMAHFWWAIANAGTPDDWINEGLAEYSAFRLSEKFYGKAFADVLIREYREHAEQSGAGVSIAETEGGSQDRYVNRYEKTTLMFIEARQRFGDEKLDRMLRTLHKRFAGTPNATTSDFLEIAETEIGMDARTFFSKVLYQKEWTDPGQIP